MFPQASDQPTTAVAPAAAIQIESTVGARQQYRRLAYMTAATDTLSVLAAFAVASLVRFGPHLPPLDLVLVGALAPFAWVGIFALYRTYEVHRLAPAEQFRRIAVAIGIGVALVAISSFWSKDSFSRLWIALAWAFALVFVVSSRRAWQGWVERRREEGQFAFRTLIAGANWEGVKLARALASGNHGFVPLGFVSASSEGLAPAGPAPLELPVLGELSSLRGTVTEARADCVFVAASALSNEQMRTVLQQMRQEGVEVRVSANLPETLSTRVTARPVDGVMTLSLRPVQLTGTQALVKRTLDLALACLGLLVLSPLFAAIAIAIKVSSPGPVLFRQTRVGRHGTRFTMLKFRTMVDGAHGLRDHLIMLNEASGPLFKIRKDPRTTRLGRWLRTWSLDELPQLVNVLKGDMSLVGPRPSLPEEVRLYRDWQFDRLEVRPGITGLWQVNGRSEVAFDEYVRLDLFYIENWSVAYDLFILAKTLPAIVSRTGAF